MVEFNRTPKSEVDAILERTLAAGGLTGPSSGSKGRTEGDAVSKAIAGTMKAGNLGTPTLPRLPSLNIAGMKRGK